MSLYVWKWRTEETLQWEVLLLWPPAKPIHQDWAPYTARSLWIWPMALLQIIIQAFSSNMQASFHFLISSSRDITRAEVTEWPDLKNYFTDYSKIQSFFLQWVTSISSGWCLVACPHLSRFIGNSVATMCWNLFIYTLYIYGSCSIVFFLQSVHKNGPWSLNRRDSMM